MPLSVRLVVIYAAALAAAVSPVSNAQSGEEYAGRYWVSVEREDATSYALLIGVEAKEPLRIRAARVPTFVDASSLPRQKELLPLFSTDFRIPIKFSEEGRGRLFVELRSSGQTVRKSYLVFELYSKAGGGEAVKVLEGYSALWRGAGKAPSVQCGDKAVSCGSSFYRDATRAGIAAGGSSVSGVIFLGVTGDMAAEPAGIDAVEWGLGYDPEKTANQVGALVSVGDERRAQQGETPGQGGGKQEPSQKSESSETKTTTAKRTDSKPKEEQKPASGPFSGATPAGSIAAFASVNEGRFGETTTEATPEFSRLKKLDKAELVLRIKHSERSWASGRVFINTTRSVEAKQDRGKYWYGDQRGGQEEFLGDIQADFDGEEIRFDVTSWVRNNAAGAYYVILENLARGGKLEVESARIEFEGVL